MTNLKVVLQGDASNVWKTMKNIKYANYRGLIICTVLALSALAFYVSTLIFPIYSPFSPYSIWNRTNITAPAVSSCHTPLGCLNSGNIYADSDLVRALIDDLKQRTRVAADSSGKDGHLTKKQRKKWEAKNPCRSRRELEPMYSLRKHAKDLPPNPLWEEVFQEYSNYHRTCMRAVGDITEYFNEQKTHTGCQFVVADTGDTIGVGNRLQVAANGVLYGIITRRVILLPTSHQLTPSICEPIVGSTWVLDSETFPAPPDRHRNKWEVSTEVFDQIDQFKSACQSTETTPSPHANLPYAAGDITNQKSPYQRFYCSTEQYLYSKITWVYLSGCLYTIPKLFAIPTFRPTLEALFPDKVVLTRIFRTMILPNDPIWTRAMRLYNTYLEPADRRVGIQMRYLRGLPQYDEEHDLVNNRVLDCALNNGILPKVDDGSLNSHNTPAFKNLTRITVLVTSLYLSLHDRVSKMYIRNPTVEGGSSYVNVIQLTHEDRQEFGVDVDKQAFTEILLLSFSDDLLLAPVSTFGGSAQAYGGLAPWFIEYRKDAKLPSCARSNSVEVCGQYTSKNFECKYDDYLGTKLFSNVVPFIEDCPQIEFPFLSENEQGIHLRTTFIS